MANKKRQLDSGSAELYGSNLDSPFAKLKGARKEKSLGWDDIEPDLLTRAAARVTEAGALFSLSKTSDGGALHIFIKNGVDIYEAYFGNVEEASAFLLEAYEAFE